ncbi:Phospholipid-transporting ATPase DNF2 [Yarrowia sp. C11]|nr:Phospholipid-transporting ATPase DNF2 [Yarrowia sp. E02]KAG5373534.1 Phospholipid-transporting ATPase DNF2 [Yarrowia sp. C11]
MPTHISFNNSEDNSDSSVSKPNKAHTHTQAHEHPIGGNPPGYSRDPQNSPALSYNWDEERLNVPNKREDRERVSKGNNNTRVYTHNNDSSNSYMDDYTSYTDDDPDDKQNPFASTNDITRHNEEDTLAEDSELADGEYDSNEGPSRRVSNRLSKPFHQLGDRIHEGFETLTRSNTKMKRNRWGTQHNPKGRPKRSKSIFNRKHSIRQQSGNQGKMSDKPVKGPRSIYFNQVLPPSAVNPETGFPMEDYPRNKIRTTKYTPLTFIPKNLFYQFRNVANIYFLLILILGFFPIFGVLSPGLATLPLIVIIVITAVKDAIEDWRRTVLDMGVNNTPTQILREMPNHNVVDDHISLWRKFKKACTRTVTNAGKKMKKEKDGKGNSPYSLELAASKTVESIVSIASDNRGNQAYPLSDMPSSGFGNNNPFASEADLANESIKREAQKPLGAQYGSVMDPFITIPERAKFKTDYWKNVRVGDIVRVRPDVEVPADLVVLSTSDSDGACYVETKNLDGETNLKVRQALKCGEGIRHSRDLERARFRIESEGPQPNLYSYNGVAKWLNRKEDESLEDSQEPININNMLLRGCTLRNTDWVIGIVIYTGEDTKIMLNAGETPSKRSKMSRELNVMVFLNFGLLFMICFVSGIVNGVIFDKSRTSMKFFEFGLIAGTASVGGLVTFFASLILYQSLVPISLYISIEIVKTIQAFFIYSDVQMYYAPIDYPCTPKSWNISDDLGQIEYIFSDKTGTLTQNVMEFKKATINGKEYGLAYTEATAGMRKRQGADVDKEAREMRGRITKDRELMLKELRKIDDNPQLKDENVTFVSSDFARDVGSDGPQGEACRHFMLALALCHSVVTEVKDDVIEFKAQSPDEAALVATARDMGFTFLDRTQRGAVVDRQGHRSEYQILNTLEFNSTRKRMSAIVKVPHKGGNKILLFCKGADSVIYSRLKPNQQSRMRQETAAQLSEFAEEGLRTLCLAQRELSRKEYEEWNRRHEEASASLVDREDKMEEVASSIECELELIGGTAIEDRLQDGVPETIELLAKAGIKLWVLTGDKVETAINIGFSCNLLNNDMELLVIRADTDDNDSTKGATPKAAVRRSIEKYLSQYFSMSGSYEELEAAKNDHSPPKGNFAVIIDGEALTYALQSEISTQFLLLCKQCRSVLCCRVSPAQKASVVRLVKNTLTVMTLSIGDGANDVAMIQEADVGVGIAGEEGRQAVMCSDYAIGQFRFLDRLLLVHGRWDYKRLAEMIPNFFYKNLVFTFTLFWYGCFNTFDAAYLYDYTIVMFYNLAFTSLPIIFLGVLDQDVPDYISIAVPQLYRSGILGIEWGMRRFVEYTVDGLYQSLVCFFFPFLMFYNTVAVRSDGLAMDHRFFMGIPVASICVIACNMYVLMNQYRWDWVSVLIFSISILLVYFWIGVYTCSTFSIEFYKAAPMVFGSTTYWAVLLLGVVAALLPHFAVLSFNKIFRPRDIDIVREEWHKGAFDDLERRAKLIADNPNYVPSYHKDDVDPIFSEVDLDLPHGMLDPSTPRPDRFGSQKFGDQLNSPYKDSPYGNAETPRLSEPYSPTTSGMNPDHFGSPQEVAGVQSMSPQGMSPQSPSYLQQSPGFVQQAPLGQTPPAGACQTSPGQLRPNPNLNRGIESSMYDVDSYYMNGEHLHTIPLDNSQANQQALQNAAMQTDPNRLSMMSQHSNFQPTIQPVNPNVHVATSPTQMGTNNPMMGSAVAPSVDQFYTPNPQYGQSPPNNNNQFDFSDNKF